MPSRTSSNSFIISAWADVLSCWGSNGTRPSMKAKRTQLRPYGAPFVSEVRESGPWRTSMTGRRNGLLKQTARIPHADCFRSLSERVVGGWPWRAAGMNFWNKRHGFLTPIVSEVCQSGPWGRAVDGQPWRACRDGLLKQTAGIPGADCCRSLQVHLFMQEHEKRKPWRVIISSKYQLTMIYTKCWLWLSHWDDSILLSYHICIKSQ